MCNAKIIDWGVIGGGEASISRLLAKMPAWAFTRRRDWGDAGRGEAAGGTNGSALGNPGSYFVRQIGYKSYFSVYLWSFNYTQIHQVPVEGGH